MFKVKVITVSDRSYRGERPDASGPAIKELLIKSKFSSHPSLSLVSDDFEMIVQEFKKAVAEGFDLIVSTGGTGFSPRDNTPEATLAVIERRAPGIPEYMRMISHKYTVNACLSRAESGIVGKSIIVNVPGSPKAARECLEAVLPALEHGILSLQGKRVDG